MRFNECLLLFELGKESNVVNIIIYYTYANYTIYIQLTCIIYLNNFYWYHFGSSWIPTRYADYVEEQAYNAYHSQTWR